MCISSRFLYQCLLVASCLKSILGGKVSSTVKVHLPKELSKPNGYDHREALFGIPPYGGSIQQNVIYAGSYGEDLCSPVQKGEWKSPFILLIDRGGCTFVQKVRNAQHAGAAAVIIADNVCQCAHEDICTPEPGEICEEHEPIMGDDGSGYDITIPSVLLFKQDVDPIKAALLHGKPVRIELSWSLPNPDNHVEWDLWTSPTDYASSQFKIDFKEAAVSLGSSASMALHMYIYDGIAAKCRTDEGINECYNLCTNNGRYCAADPDNDLDYGISGADVVTESLRRLCIWENYGDNGVGAAWWDYVRAFVDQCDTSELFMEEECVIGVMNQVGIDFNLIKDCMSSHGGLDNDAPNSLLEKQLQEKDSNGIVVMPVVYVNGVAVRGAMEFATVFKAICSGFARHTEPSVCSKCADCYDEKKCVLNGRCPASAGTVGQGTFVGSLAGLTLSFSLLGVALYMRQQRQMKEQVRSMVKQYMPLDLQNENVDTALEQDDSDGILT